MDHTTSHADNGQHERYDCCAFSRWRFAIPHVTWRPRRDWSRADNAFDLPTDDDLVSLANTLYPTPGKMRPQHHVLTALVAERHLCRWAKQPMSWRNRAAIRQPITLADGTIAGVAGRWIAYSGEIPPVITITRTGLDACTVAVAVVWHDFDHEPEFIGWQEVTTWKRDGHKGKTDLGLSGIALNRSQMLPIKQLQPRTSERQTTLFTLSG